MGILNLGILAHVDAGKTSLTERLLFATGVMDELGSVDGGSTRTDSTELERRRGITIQSAVVSFTLDGLDVNLIDTPGHADFIAEVERAVRVLDGAVLVVSAVEGVQAQTRVLLRTLTRLRIPTLIFVNKIDRAGARHTGLLADIAAKLTPAGIAMNAPENLGTRSATVVPGDLDEHAVDVLTANSEEFLACYLAGETTGCWDELRRQTHDAMAHPIYFGSAVIGIGVPELLHGIRNLLPAAAEDDGPLRGTVFKIERDAGQKVAYARLFGGTLRTRDEIPFFRGDEEHSGKVTAMEVYGGDPPRAGSIVKLWGLSEIRIGDRLGAADKAAVDAGLSPPTLATVVRPAQADDGPLLYAALRELAERDPFIGVHRDDEHGEISVRLYGELQKEVIKAQLHAARSGVVRTAGRSPIAWSR